ncbi:hypothetical protein FC72_GL001877 [Companilactobacillus tucceti DSM 20183]|uniref:Uncharacterized protein n=2 Tax=Companilactobacillus tucceti TaxID=238012 RepID=A0A0R1JC72_9LACO|nr:hypothetical protein FC72_GL001877 [Companilactobacillus tucceti DSM 20183]
MLLTITEMTINPMFYVGRIFLVLSVLIAVLAGLNFVKSNWRFVNEDDDLPDPE